MKQTKNPKLDSKEYERISSIEENFKVMKKFNDPRFGNVAIIEVPGNSRKLMVKEKVFTSKSDLTNEIYAVKRRIGLANVNLLNFVDYSTGSRSDFCSTNYWIKLFFEYPDHDLDQELKRRARFNIAGLNGDELTHLMYQVADAGAFLNSNQLYHGDINPEHIEVDNPERYRLVEKFGDMAKPEEGQNVKIATNAELHVAPEIYQKGKLGAVKAMIKNNQAQPFYEKADVFSFGLTLLQAGCDQSIQGIYGKQGTINNDAFERLKQQFVGRFGADNNLLVTTVMSMLQTNPDSRPDFRTIIAHIPPYGEVKGFLDQEKSRPTHNPDIMLASNPNGIPGSHYSAIHGPVRPNDIYNQYLVQNSWETEWGNRATPIELMQKAMTPTGAASGVLGTHLNLPQATPSVYNQSAQTGVKPGQKVGQGYGVVPQLGAGIQTNPQAYNLAQQGIQPPPLLPSQNSGFQGQPYQGGSQQGNLVTSGLATYQPTPNTYQANPYQAAPPSPNLNMSSAGNRSTATTTGVPAGAYQVGNLQGGNFQGQGINQQTGNFQGQGSIQQTGNFQGQGSNQQTGNFQSGNLQTGNLQGQNRSFQGQGANTQNGNFGATSPYSTGGMNYTGPNPSNAPNPYTASAATTFASKSPMQAGRTGMQAGPAGPTTLNGNTNTSGLLNSSSASGFNSVSSFVAGQQGLAPRPY